MATPDIGTSISEGYSRGLDRLSRWLPALVVLGILVGVVAGVGAQIQDSLIPDAGEIFRDALAGRTSHFDENDVRIVSLVGAVVGAINLLIGLGSYALFGGILHRERHGGEGGDEPTPGSVLGSVLGQVSNLMPKAGLLVGLFVVAQVAGPLLGVLGSIIGFALWLFFIFVAIKWVYAPIVGGSGEATGDDAFGRSEAVVSGAWWRTFGCFIVIFLAIGLPVAIAAAIVQFVVPTAFLGALAGTVTSTVLGVPIISSALESAWAHVEDSAGGGHGGHDHIEPTAAPQDPPAAPQAPTDTEGHSGPFV